MNLRIYLKKYYPKYHCRNNHIVTNISDYDGDMTENSIFVACGGYMNSGEKFIDSAIDNGAKTIFYQSGMKINKRKGINYIEVEDSKVELARLLKWEISERTTRPIFIGVTGTTGKTSVTFLFYQYLKDQNYDVLLLGTGWIYSYYGLEEKIVTTDNTTPKLSLLYRCLREKDYNYDYVIMEVSSQGIAEGRVLGIPFDLVSITNLSKEHLDYHHTFNEYKITKGRLLFNLDNNSSIKKIILNYDDNTSLYYRGTTLDEVYSFGIQKGQVQAKQIERDFLKTSFTLVDTKNEFPITTNLMGDFNVSNFLNLWQLNKALELKKEKLLQFFRKELMIPGRMNVIGKNGRYFIVDYAHTINAVEAVFLYIDSVKGKRKIISVLGCGGNRDTLKRPVIGSIACKYSELVIFTEDNSRDEDPHLIISDILKGVETENYKVVVNRKEAIIEAYQNSTKGDIILVLGKGVENYLIREKGRKIPYNDQETILALEEEPNE